VYAPERPGEVSHQFGLLADVPSQKQGIANLNAKPWLMSMNVTSVERKLWNPKAIVFIHHS